MIAAMTRAAPALAWERIDTESLFKRLDSDGNGRLTVADRASAVLRLTTQAVARYTDAAIRAGQRPDQQALPGARPGGAVSARYQAVQSLAA